MINFLIVAGGITRFQLIVTLRISSKFLYLL